MGHRGPEEGLEATPGHRRHRARQRLHLGYHRSQHPAQGLAEVLGIRPVGHAHRARNLGEQGAHQFSLLPQGRGAGSIGRRRRNA